MLYTAGRSVYLLSSLDGSFLHRPSSVQITVAYSTRISCIQTRAEVQKLHLSIFAGFPVGCVIFLLGKYVQGL
jgi:hypothetical protein